MQTSIFDLPINSIIGELPTAIVKPKQEPALQPETAITARASPEFAIGAIVQSPKYFKKLNGEIIGFEQHGGVDFAILRYQWYESTIDYPAIASNLISVIETPLSEIGLPTDNPELKIGDRVKVLEHQFMRDRLGTIQKLESKMATVDFGATENIWCISIKNLQKHENQQS
jgi:hypothetical protein